MNGVNKNIFLSLGFIRNAYSLIYVFRPIKKGNNMLAWVIKRYKRCTRRGVGLSVDGGVGIMK